MLKVYGNLTNKINKETYIKRRKNDNEICLAEADNANFQSALI